MKISKDILGSMITRATLAIAYLAEIAEDGNVVEITKSELGRLTKEENEYLARIVKENGLTIRQVSKSTTEGGNAKIFAQIAPDEMKAFRTALANLSDAIDLYNEENDTPYWIQIAYMSHPKSKKNAN